MFIARNDKQRMPWSLIHKKMNLLIGTFLKKSVKIYETAY